MPNEPAEPVRPDEAMTLRTRIAAAAWALTGLLRSASLFGIDVRVDMIERKDARNPDGRGYTEVQVQFMDDEEESHGAGKL